MHLLLEVLAVGEGSWFMYAFVGIIGAFALAMVAATRSDEEKRRSEYPTTTSMLSSVMCHLAHTQ